MSPGGAWTAARQDGLGDATNVGIEHLFEFKGNLYASTWNGTNVSPNYRDGGQLWCSANGTEWDKVVDAGFGDRTNSEVFRLAILEDQIYASTWGVTSTHGTEVWRSSNGDSGSWEPVVPNGFGNPANFAVLSMEVYNSFLYATTYNVDGAPPIFPLGVRSGVLRMVPPGSL